MKIICTNSQRELLVSVLVNASDCCFVSTVCEDREFNEPIEDVCKRCLHKNIEWDIVEK